MLPALLVMLLLAACAGPQPSLYAPRDGRDGYAQEELGKGLFRVTFQGNHVTSRERAEDYALYRAAELTLEVGAERFAVHDRLTERFTKVTREYYDPYPYGPYWTHRPYYYRRPAQSFYDERTTYLAQLTIEPFTGIAPGDVGKVYRAREVMERLAPQIVRPAPKTP
ncbi:MAG: CC0125/CC1285 family lipoprotein [Bacteroidota bacterium]|nr:hypothetical protein [Kiloniellaceae bacterium]